MQWCAAGRAPGRRVREASFPAGPRDRGIAGAVAATEAVKAGLNLELDMLGTRAEKQQ
jgi:hypothetical protein